MDLAGLDIPTKRTYSSAVATDENVDYPTTEGDETDRRFYTAIHHATQDGRRDFCNSLVAHYRSPRDGPSPHPELESHLPRPEGYSVGTYNACLNALLSVRRDGESIAPILEMYNEMLEREIMPNGRTYVSVIKALCYREKDVQSAVKQDTEQRKWFNFKSTQLGLPRPKNGSKDVIKGYLSEGNFESAYNLFTGIKNVQTAAAPNGFYRFHPQVYSYLLDALATRERPSREVVPIAMDIFEHAVETDTASHRLLYKHLFRLLGKTKDIESTNALWTRFETEHAEGKGRKMREWKDVLPGTEIDEREVQVEGFQREVWNSAIKAFVQVGQVEKGLALLDQMLAREGKVSLDKAPRAKEDTLGVAIALAERGEYERSKAIVESAPVGLRPMDLGMYLDALCAGGQWKTALDVYLPILANAPEDIRPDVHRIKRIYTSILGSSRESLEPLSHIPTLMSTGTYMIDPDLATAHIKLLLQHGHLDAIAPVLNGFGPMKVRMEQSVRAPMLTLLGEIVGSPIEFKEMLEVLHGFSRQQIYPVAAQQKVIAGIIDKYMASSSRDSIDQQGWTTLSWVFSRTTSSALEQGEYDAALEAFISDITAHAPETLKLDTEGRVIRLIAEKLFNRFGSDRATSMLTPLLGEEQTLKTLEEFYQVSEPELAYDSASSSSDAAPSTPPAPAAQAPRRLVIDDALSRRIDTHQQRPDGNFQITPQKAYNELRSALSSNRIPHPDSLVRLLLTLSREGDEPRVLELYSLGQNLIQSTPNPKAQSTWWRQFEDAMIIAQCHLSHLEQAGLHRHRLVERGMAPSADAYATMIASSKDTTDDAQVARELWTESQSLGVRPHLYLYNTVISKLSKARKADTALEMFGQMKERGVRPSSVTYGAVIVGHPNRQ
jgi:pentatricopeptide repeat protein